MPKTQAEKDAMQMFEESVVGMALRALDNSIEAMLEKRGWTKHPKNDKENPGYKIWLPPIQNLPEPVGAGTPMIKGG